MDAKPTQYKGKVFKSKTEAMFALILDAKLNKNSRWIYEDSRYKTPYNYIPDFAEHFGVEAFLSDFISLIEIKPAMPNKTYIEYLQKQFQWIKANDKFHFINWYCLTIFNPYKRTIESVLMDDNGNININDLEKPAWFKDDYFDLALTYRFDL